MQTMQLTWMTDVLQPGTYFSWVVDKSVGLVRSNELSLSLLPRLSMLHWALWHTRSYKDLMTTIRLSCTAGASYPHHGRQPGSYLHCKESCDAYNNQAHGHPQSLCQGSSCWRDNRSTVLSNGIHGCRHSDETTTQGKIRLFAQNHRTAEVILLSADELSGHSCGVDYN